MADHSDDERGKHHLQPAAPAEPGDIDAGLTPQQAVNGHPADQIENQHNLEADILPIDAVPGIAETITSSEETRDGTPTKGK